MPFTCPWQATSCESNTGINHPCHLQPLVLSSSGPACHALPVQQQVISSQKCKLLVPVWRHCLAIPPRWAAEPLISWGKKPLDFYVINHYQGTSSSQSVLGLCSEADSCKQHSSRMVLSCLGLTEASSWKRGSRPGNWRWSRAKDDPPQVLAALPGMLGCRSSWEGWERQAGCLECAHCAYRPLPLPWAFLTILPLPFLMLWSALSPGRTFHVQDCLFLPAGAAGGCSQSGSQQAAAELKLFSRRAAVGSSQGCRRASDSKGGTAGQFWLLLPQAGGLRNACGLKCLMRLCLKSCWEYVAKKQGKLNLKLRKRSRHRNLRKGGTWF